MEDKEYTMEELVCMVNDQEQDFIIQIRLGEEYESSSESYR